MDHLRKKLKECTTPSDISKLHLETAYEYSIIAEEYEKLIPAMAELKRQLLQDNGSVTRAQMLYKTHQIGVREAQFKIRLNSMSKFLSGLKQRKETLDNEARNQY